MSAEFYRNWKTLRVDVARLSQQRGVKVWIARKLGVSRSAVSQWLTGASVPSADAVLFLSNWAREKTAPQQKARDSASNTITSHKARSKRIAYEETRKRAGPRK
jgi:transcriptional regulator with XRE-family HTH domain